jgi:hypothetical protein
LTLPPGATLPPGITLPPGLAPPTGGGPFFVYAATSKSEVAGNHHLDSRTLPGCRQTQSDEKWPYFLTGALIQVTIDPNDPNHLVGEKVISETSQGKTVVKWDLTRDVE